MWVGVYKMAENQLYEKIMGLALNDMAKPYSTLFNFIENKNNMDNANLEGGDKYFHANANCQSGQYGDMGTALILSIGKEIKDIKEKNWGKTKNNYTLIENLLDSRQDFEADNYGLLQGILNPLGDCRFLLDQYRPKGLDYKY